VLDDIILPGVGGVGCSTNGSNYHCIVEAGLCNECDTCWLLYSVAVVVVMAMFGRGYRSTDEWRMILAPRFMFMISRI
jgi:hypothetical protein